MPCDDAARRARPSSVGGASTMRAWLGGFSSLVLASCMVKAGGQATGGPGVPGGPTTGGSAIEAGCSFRGNELQGEPGATFQVSCPGSCTDGSIYGTEVYTSDSAVCVAAVHAG